MTSIETKIETEATCSGNAIMRIDAMDPVIQCGLATANLTAVLDQHASQTGSERQIRLADNSTYQLHVQPSDNGYWEGFSLMAIPTDATGGIAAKKIFSANLTHYADRAGCPEGVFYGPDETQPVESSTIVSRHDEQSQINKLEPSGETEHAINALRMIFAGQQNKLSEEETAALQYVLACNFGASAGGSQYMSHNEFQQEVSEFARTSTLELGKISIAPQKDRGVTLFTTAANDRYTLDNGTVAVERQLQNDPNSQHFTLQHTIDASACVEKAVNAKPLRPEEARVVDMIRGMYFKENEDKTLLIDAVNYSGYKGALNDIDSDRLDRSFWLPKAADDREILGNGYSSEVEHFIARQVQPGSDSDNRISVFTSYLAELFGANNFLLKLPHYVMSGSEGTFLSDVIGVSVSVEAKDEHEILINASHVVDSHVSGAKSAYEGASDVKNSVAVDCKKAFTDATRVTNCSAEQCKTSFKNARQVTNGRGTGFRGKIKTINRP